MLSNKPVLPNFLKMLTITLFTLGSVSAFADGHGDKKIGELKDMKADKATQVEEAATPELSDLDAAAKEAMADEATDADGAMDELKEKASSLADE